MKKSTKLGILFSVICFVLSFFSALAASYVNHKFGSYWWSPTTIVSIGVIATILFVGAILILVFSPEIFEDADKEEQKGIYQ